MDNLLQLPVDVLINILKKLILSDIYNVMLTCKTMKNLIVDDNTLWRSVCKDRLVLHNSSSHSYKLSWYNHCRVSYHWCRGYYRSKVVINHYTNYMPWVMFHNSEALVLSVGSELHCYPKDKKGIPNGKETLWKLDVPKVQRHDVRTNDISRFIIKDKLIVCGNRDGCVAVYKLNDIYRKPKLQCHIQNCHDHGQVEVTAVELINNKSKPIIVSGSNNSSNIMLWHLSDVYCNNASYISLYENAGVRCLSMNIETNELAIGLNGNSKPLLLDVNTGQHLVTADATKDAKQAVRDVRWHGRATVAYVTHSGVLALLDARSHQQVYTVRDPFQSSLYCVKTDGHRAILVGSAEYSRCVLFDARNHTRHVQMYFTQRKTSPVYSLDFDTTKLITAVDRGIAVLNFNINTSTVEQRDYSHVFS